MALGIDGAKIGFDKSGFKSLTDSLDSTMQGAIDDTTKGVGTVIDEMNSFWIGEAANAYSKKLNTESEELVKSLSILKTGILESLQQILVNMENSDQEIANSIQQSIR